LTPGEVMQLPSDDELVLVAGAPPIRAKKARYFEDSRLKRRILPPPQPASAPPRPDVFDGPPPAEAWSRLPAIIAPAGKGAPTRPAEGGDGGLRWEAEPEAPDHAIPDVEAPMPTPEPELEVEDDDDDLAAMQARFRRVARQA